MARTKEGCAREKLLRDIRICFGLTDSNNSVIDSLVSDLYWQIVKLEECRKLIDDTSIAVKFVQGKQDMVIQNPAVKTYNDLIKNQATTIKSLQAITGKGKNADEELKELMKFIRKPKKK